MTAPFRTLCAGLVYAAADLMDLDSGLFLELVVGIGEIPAVRGEDTTVPGLAGRVPGNRVNDVLALELRGHVRAADGLDDPVAMAASYVANLLAVRTLFASNRTPASLVATLIDGTILTITARPLSIIPAETIPAEYAEVSVTLEGLGDWVVS